MRAILLIWIGGLILLAGCTSADESLQDSHSRPDINQHEKIVEIVGMEFRPRMVTISVGDTVTWLNLGVAPGWPASNQHPSHIDYRADYSMSGSYAGSIACLGEDQPKLGAFDSCGEVGSSEKYSFTFYQKGTWHYHDHLNPSITGTVIVQ